MSSSFARPGPRSAHASLVLGVLVSFASPAWAQPNTDDIESWADAQCARIFECFPGAELHRQFGDDLAECIARSSGYKERTMLAPGAVTDTSLASCADAMRAATCDAFIDSFFFDASALPACWENVPGTRALGESCAYGAQCASLFCQSAEGSCGFCAELPGVGQPCDFNFGCDAFAGATCDFQSGLCVDGASRGDACGPGAPCFGSTQCVAGICEPFDLAGTPCDPNGSSCAFVTDGLICNNQTAECEAGVARGAGENCGLGGPTGGVDFCDADSLCDMTFSTTPNPASGTCVAAELAALGEPCAYATFSFSGSACLDVDARCEGGVCVVDDASTCPDAGEGEGEGEGGEGEGEGGEGEGEGEACKCAADCDEGEACGAGVCAPACSATDIACEGGAYCVLDANGDGACVAGNEEGLAPTGAVCSSGSLCIAGTCQLAFSLTRSVCGGACSADGDCPDDGVCGEDGACLARPAVCPVDPDADAACSCASSRASPRAPVGTVALLAMVALRSTRRRRSR